MSVYRLNAAGTAAGATNQARANVQVRADGVLYAYAANITGEAYAPVSAAQQTAQAEFSFNQREQFDENDTTDTFASVHADVTGTPTGAVTGGVRCDGRSELAGLRIPVYQGQRIYIHLRGVNQTLVRQAECYLYVEDGLDGRPRAR